MSALRWPADSPTGAQPAAPGRLRRRAEFAAVYRRGRSWSDALVALRVLPTPLPECRVGYAVGKRVGNAVVRNRVKRRLREALRRLAPRPGVDLVVIARGEAAAASYDELLASLGRLLGRARLLPGERAR